MDPKANANVPSFINLLFFFYFSYKSNTFAYDENIKKRLDLIPNMLEIFFFFKQFFKKYDKVYFVTQSVRLKSSLDCFASEALAVTCDKEGRWDYF